MLKQFHDDINSSPAPKKAKTLGAAGPYEVHKKAAPKKKANEKPIQAAIMSDKMERRHQTTKQGRPSSSGRNEANIGAAAADATA